jgi:hypothetical protein
MKEDRDLPEEDLGTGIIEEDQDLPLEDIRDRLPEDDPDRLKDIQDLRQEDLPTEEDLAPPEKIAVDDLMNDCFDLIKI